VDESINDANILTECVCNHPQLFTNTNDNAVVTEAAEAKRNQKAYCASIFIGSHHF
jgi:hypothetical protein